LIFYIEVVVVSVTLNVAPYYDNCSKCHYISLTMPPKKRQHVSKERNKKNAILDDSGDEDDFSVTQKIVEFYEGHPYLFDLRHENYRNNKLKEAKLAELATYIKWNGQ
ncbi:unnamed protein product, partial [Owenia fusiformis]